MPTTNKEREMRIAQRRVEGFAQQFGEAHRNLARHAAFPLVLTPDLLYQIWANFVPEAPWTAVAHVLLSRLCRQVGYEMYEMDIGDRNLLLRELKGEFGQERFDELGEFLLDYVAQRLTDDDTDTQDLREAQEWTALAYTKPDGAAWELTQALSERMQREDMGEVLRLASLVETLAEPLVEAELEPLLIYSKGIKSFVYGNLEDAVAQFEEIIDQESHWLVADTSSINIKQIINEISKSIESKLRTLQGSEVMQRGFDRQIILPEKTLGDHGRGVVVGIIDIGCDFAHRNFRNPDGSTRLLAFWNQDGDSSPNSPYGYGQEYKPDEINQALGASDPYAALGYELTKRAHGTHVMDIAVGNGQGTGFSGVAPAADIVFVQLSQNEFTPLIENGKTAVRQSFGDFVAVLEAIRYIFDIAGDRPCVINIGLGLYGGPHDGSTLVEQLIDALVSEKPNRAIVVAAGNSYDIGIHASGIVLQNHHFDLQWQIPHRNPRQKEIEVWYDGGDRFQLEILAPDGTSLGRVDLGENGEVVDTEDKTIIFFTNRQSDPNNGDNVICVFMESDLPGEIWTLRLHGVQVTNGKFHAWIEREDHSQSCFVPPHDNTHTLNTIACGYKSIVVGSYDDTRTDKRLSFFSGSGPTRDGRQKPEFIASGHHIWAAASRTETQTIRMSGTTMAASVVTGIIALMLAEALICNQSLTIDEIRDILAASAHKNFPMTDQPERYGYGIIDPIAAVSAVRNMSKIAKPV